MKKTSKIVARHIFLALLAFIWLIPIIWLVVTTFSAQKGINTNHFFPEHWTLANYHQLFSVGLHCSVPLHHVCE